MESILVLAHTDESGKLLSKASLEAVAAGERAAVGIDTYLTGKNHAFWRETKPVEVPFDPDADPADTPRERLRMIPVERRRSNFDEVEQPWPEGIAVRQAKIR